MASITPAEGQTPYNTVPHSQEISPRENVQNTLNNTQRATLEKAAEALLLLSNNEVLESLPNEQKMDFLSWSQTNPEWKGV